MNFTQQPESKGKKMVENQPKDQFNLGWTDSKTEEEKKKEEENEKADKTYVPLKKKGENFDEKVHVPLKKKEDNFGKITGETGTSPSPIKQKEPEPTYQAKQPPGGRSNLQLF